MSFTLRVKENRKTKELYIQFPKKLLSELGWKTGDQIEWTPKNETFILSKIDNTVSKNSGSTTVVDYSFDENN